MVPAAGTDSRSYFYNSVSIHFMNDEYLSRILYCHHFLVILFLGYSLNNLLRVKVYQPGFRPPRSGTEFFPSDPQPDICPLDPEPDIVPWDPNPDFWLPDPQPNFCPMDPEPDFCLSDPEPDFWPPDPEPVFYPRIRIRIVKIGRR